MPPPPPAPLSSPVSRLNALLFEAQSGQLIRNQTIAASGKAYVQFASLRPATLYSVCIYAMNDHGKSPPLYLQAATLGPPEKRQMSQGIIS